MIESARVARVASCAVIGAALGGIGASVAALTTRPLPPLAPWTAVAAGLAAGAVAGTASLRWPGLEAPPRAWTALRGLLARRENAGAVLVGLLTAVAISFFVVAGRATNVVAELLQLPETATGRVAGGSVRSTTRTVRGREEFEQSSSVRYEFRVDGGPRAGDYEGHGLLDGGTSLGTPLDVRYDPDDPTRNRISDSKPAAARLAIGIAVAVLSAWTGLALWVLRRRGAAAVGVVLLTWAIGLPFAALACVVTHVVWAGRLG